MRASSNSAVSCLSWIDASESARAPLFARSHAEVESHLRHSGIAYTIVRATVFMQNHLQLLAGRGKGVIYGASGEGKASLVDARDVAAVAATALTETGHEGQTWSMIGRCRPDCCSSAPASLCTPSRLAAAALCVDCSCDASHSGAYPVE